MNKKLNFVYYDNDIYKKLVRKENECYWNVFYDSVISKTPSLDDGEYVQIFTPHNLLEAIGDGRFKEKYKGNNFQIPRDFLRKFSLGFLENIKKQDETLRDITEAPIMLFEAARAHYAKHPELNQKILLTKIDKELEWACSKAASVLISDTLLRWRKEIEENYEGFLTRISIDLAWDTACGYDYIFLDEVAKEKKDAAREEIRKIHQVLLRMLHDNRIMGLELISYRLCDAIYRELFSSPASIADQEKQLEKSIARVECPFKLDPRHDLCDTDVIHYATLGYYDSKSKTTHPVQVYTSDAKYIKDRLALQLPIIRNLCSEAKGGQMKMVAGSIFIVDYDTAKIIDEIDINSFQKSQHKVEVTLYHD